MKSLLYISLFILFFGSSVVSKPQEVKKSSIQTKPIDNDFEPSIDYDSLYDEARKNAEAIKRDREFVQKNEQYLKNLARKKDRAYDQVKDRLFELEASKKKLQDTADTTSIIKLDTTCMHDRVQLTSNPYKLENCSPYRVDTLTTTNQ